MAVDARILLKGLDEYRRVLDQHSSLLKMEFDTVETRWQQFSEHYEGEAADQFRAGWIRTTDNFKDYIEQTERIRRLLEERIEALRDADRAEAGLIG